MIKAKLFVLGVEREVAWSNLEYFRYTNAITGKPGEMPMGGLISLSFISAGGDDKLLRWLTHSPEDELCHLEGGKVVFYDGDFDGLPLFEYKFNDAALVNWEENFTADDDVPMTVSMNISAAIQEVKGVSFNRPWLVSDVGDDEDKGSSEPMEQASKIVSVDWVDESGADIADIFYSQKAVVKVGLQHQKGGQVKVKITKKDGTEFENGKKEINLSASAKDGQILFSKLEMKRDWLEFKKVKRDELIAEASYDGNTKSSAELEIKPPKDIIQFVAGTTDPINLHGLKNQANKDYWRGADNLWANVKKLKPQFLDLHIEDTFFSWSGDNSTEERTKGAEKLLDTLLRVYSGWKENEEVHLHLIGHSHGGNVINQFTNIIEESGDFPEHWKVKSITYLSTPFFNNQHQLNPGKLHSDCKIINVHNDYDITQRFVADFTMKNLEYLIGNFIDMDKLKEAVEAVKAVDMAPFDVLTDFNINNHEEGPALWTAMRDILFQAEIIMGIVKKNVAFMGKRNVVSAEKQEFLSIINDIHAYLVARLAVFNANLTNRNGGYGRSEFLEDLSLQTAMPEINRILNIRTGEVDSFFLGFLDSVFMEEENGLVAKIDDTSTSPSKQVKGQFTIDDFDITDLDPYHKRGRKAAFEGFARGIENAQKRADDTSLREILMRMVSQFVEPETLATLINRIDWAEYIVTGELDRQLKEARRNLGVYLRLVTAYNANLVTEADQNNDALEVKPGSIPYLAMTAHSLSHTDLFDDAKHNVKKSLMEAFSSGKNPGYQG